MNYTFTEEAMKKRITKEDIFKTAYELEKDGKEVTSTLIREELGSGSLSTITKYLKEWMASKVSSEENYPEIKDVVESVEEELLVEFFSNELPQVTALVFSYLEPKKVAAVLKQYDEEKRNQILEKMENMDFVQSRIVGHIAKVLESEFRSVSLAKGEQVGGKKFVSSIRQELAG